MARTSTPSFICTFGLRVTSAQEKRIERRFEIARLNYNELLRVAKFRLGLVRGDPEYARLMQALKDWHALSKKMGATPSKNVQKGLKDTRLEIAAGFKALREKHRFSEYDLHRTATEIARTRCHLGSFSEIDSMTAQKLASRAFRACDEVLTLKRGMPRFKGKGQPLGSLEGKSNLSGLIFRSEDMTFRWGKDLKLEMVYDDQDSYHVHAVGSRTKYVRLVRQRVKGKIRYSAQLVCEGLPLQKRPTKIAHGVEVGLDMGPSTIAAVSQSDALLTEFCAEIEDSSKEIRRLNRKVDRQRRAGNPQNYDDKGRILKGKKLTWAVSARMRKTQDQLSELRRREAAHRKSLHGKLSNDLLELGTVFKVEQLSVKAWQKMWGKSIGKKSPGMFQSELVRKAERAGGAVEWINPWQAKLSQRCICASVQKKTLSERMHACERCGTRAQRDLWSAYLALQTQGGRWGATGPIRPSPGVEQLLSSAHHRAVNEAAMRGRKVSSFGPVNLVQSRSGLAKKFQAGRSVMTGPVTPCSRPADTGESTVIGTPGL